MEDAPSLELAEIATSTSPLPERAQNMLDRLRRFVPFDPQLEVKTMSTKASQEDAYQRRQVAATVRAAISELSPKLRLPILLKYVEGLSYEEIAVALNCSIGTVSSRLNRGHKALAKRLAHLRGQVVLGD